jgi:Heparinase II/III-like protein
MPAGVLATCFSPERLAAHLGRPGCWRPYPELRDRAAWETVPTATRDHVLGQAARILAQPWPVLTASGYARFFADGDRQAYERPYFARRSRLGSAVLTAALAGPTAERLSEVTDGIWLLCEETSWCVPAAELNARRDGASLPDPARPVVDLFAAETAALLAYADLLAGDLIEPVVRRRLRDEVRVRVLGPYRDSDHWWWFGLRKKDLNNWTPWIHANLLAASLLLDDQPRDVVVTAERAVGALDRYLDAVPDDGGCDEGIGYWWRAGGSLLEGLEILAGACGDDYGVFEIGKIRAIARYPVTAHIADRWHVNFADGAPKPNATTPHVLYRYGRRIGDQEVTQHARALRGGHAATDLIAGANGSIARVLSAMFDTSWEQEPPRPFPMPAQAWLPVTGVLMARSQAGRSAGLFLAAKAGHNGEGHNHNDVGSFIVAVDGQPMLIDVGVGVYRRQTFGNERFEIWTMQSSWHSVPEVNGVGQAAGRAYAARRVQALLSPRAAELSMDLAGAYPPEAGIRSWRRTVRLDRGETGDGTLVLEDAWDLNHCAERTVVHLIAARAPREMATGQLVIPAAYEVDPADSAGRGLVLGFARADFDAEIEERPVGDPRLAAVWGASVYRIALVARCPGRQGRLHLEMVSAGSVL